jgi:uncharacterized protein YcbX
MPSLDRITIYPVKSLDGMTVDEARLLPEGGLEHDRRWRLVDAEGRVVNAKREPLLLAIRARVGLDGPTIGLAPDQGAVAAAMLPGSERLAELAPESFPLVPGGTGPSGWLSAALGRAVLLVERRDGGFPDDRDATGPTVVAAATLREVARWFGFELDECRRRFRVNLEVGDCEAFWEDVIASPAEPDLATRGPLVPADLPPPEPRALRIGGALLQAAHVCRRCPVPARNSRTGEMTPHFRDAFEARRRHGLRGDVDGTHWSDSYRLAINTVVRIPGAIAVTADVSATAGSAGGGSCG